MLTNENCAKFMRNFVENREDLKIMNKGSVFIYFKANRQLYTNVDLISQSIFERNMKKFYPDLEIIGEENLNDQDTIEYLNYSSELFEKYMITNESISSLKENFDRILKNVEDIDLLNANESKLEEMIKMKEIKILLDPLDATFSFINKDFNESTILTGVLINNRPYLGFITSPFYNFNHKNVVNKDIEILTYFNVPTKGIFSFRNCQKNNYYFEKLITKRNDEEWNDMFSKDLNFIVSRSREDRIKRICK